MIDKVVVNIDLFRSYFDYYVTDNIDDCIKEINKKNKKLKLQLDNGNSLALCFNRGRQIIIIDRKYLTINLIAHETFHAVSGLLKSNRATPLKESSEETYAYLLDYAINNFLKKYNNLKKGEFINKKLIE